MHECLLVMPYNKYNVRSQHCWFNASFVLTFLVQIRDRSIALHVPWEWYFHPFCFSEIRMLSKAYLPTNQIMIVIIILHTSLISSFVLIFTNSIYAHVCLVLFYFMVLTHCLPFYLHLDKCIELSEIPCRILETMC